MLERDGVLILVLLLTGCNLGLHFLICEMEIVIVIQFFTGVLWALDERAHAKCLEW